MNRTMQTIQEDIDAIVPYSMHVSSRYLDLTKQKLELTRLPKENEELGTDEQWKMGTPKTVLEPLLDHWLEAYDWRASEEYFNATLPQFRTLISLPPAPAFKEGKDRNGIRTHFVHVHSPDASAYPLLYIHDWPGSFIEAARIIPLLANPASSSSAATVTEHQKFHVVCPSIPGFGFSDASTDASFGIAGAAEVFAGLMQRLGYDDYVVCAGGWGLEVARVLAAREKGRVRGVFTWNAVFTRPTLKDQLGTWVKWQIARATGARWPALGFGYVPSEVKAQQIRQNGERNGGNGRPVGLALHQLLASRPQTLAFSLCDSPVGLLALLLDLIPAQRSLQPLDVRPRSPFLDPGELEMQERNRDVEVGIIGHERVRSDDTVRASQNGTATARAERRIWTPTDILNWTMMMWLPGAESGLRWLRRAAIESSSPAKRSRLSTPLGISTFRSRGGTSPVMWGSAEWEIKWVRRRETSAEMPVWEVPELLVGDVREWFGGLLGRVSEEEVV